MKSFPLQLRDSRLFPSSRKRTEFQLSTPVLILSLRRKVRPCLILPTVGFLFHPKSLNCVSTRADAFKPADLNQATVTVKERLCPACKWRLRRLEHALITITSLSSFSSATAVRFSSSFVALHVFYL